MAEERLTSRYVTKKYCSKGRKLLILEWMLIGLFLTICYKLVLLSSLVSITYEKPIDTVGDLLETDKPIVALGNSSTSRRLKNDLRLNVRKWPKESHGMNSMKNLLCLIGFLTGKYESTLFGK